MRWFLTALALILPMPSSAQGWIEPPPIVRVLPRPLPLQRVEKVRTSVTVRVTDRVARVDVQESFRNTGGGLAEGHYMYPLPGEAVFSDVSLFQGEEELKGETMDARRARAIYEDIVRRHRDPALIELAGHGLLRARVFPIRPGETRMLTLRYTQVLPRAGDALHFRYVAGTPRSGAASGTAQGAAENLVRNGADRETAPLSFTLVSDDAARFGEPFSPTHRLRVSRDGGRLVVRAAEELSGSFDVFLPLAGPDVGIALATHRVDGEDGYFMLTLSPGRVRATPAPRDVAVLLDVSGSMSGEKIEQARQALHRLLDTLNPSDRFRLVAFSNRVQMQRREWTDATRPAVTEARAWIDRLGASGGTGIAAALDEVLRTPSADGRLHLVIVITDGLPTVGETDPERIAARAESARGDARIFTFGVGYDVHTHLLERLAAAGAGTVDYVEPGRDVEEAVGSLADRISHPVLVNLRFAGSPVRLKDVQPGQLPDLYAGQELVVFGRYEAERGTAGELAIAGTRSGRDERFAAQVEFPEHAASGDYIPRLWAARTIGDLMRTIRLEGETPERIAQVSDLALRYGLLSEYTSHLVQEPGLGPQMTTSRVGPGAAPAAVAVAGEAAVTAAQLAAARREVRNVADAVAAETVAIGRIDASRADRRLVGGRTFRLESGVWIDAGHAVQARVVSIEPFSRAYFEVLARLPELRPYWSAFESVTVSGGQVSIRVAAGGRAALEAGELDRLVNDFRRMR